MQLTLSFAALEAEIERDTNNIVKCYTMHKKTIRRREMLGTRVLLVMLFLLLLWKIADVFLTGLL